MNKLKEIEEPQKNLLIKQEEQEALQFIRKFLILQATTSWNKENLHKITERDVSLNLKKTGDRSPIQRYDDLIFYISNVPYRSDPYREATIVFRIAKKNDGKVLVSWYHSFGEGDWYIVSRGFVKPKSHEILPENVENKISKEDEQRALQAIRIYMVPKAVSLYNQRAEQENLPKVDINVVRQNLKKKRENYKGISYYSEVSKDVVFVFTIVKYHPLAHKPEKLMVHCTNPIGCNMGMYVDYPETLNENIKCGISKEDEQRAIQYIRYRLIPFFVDKVYTKFLSTYKPSVIEYPRIGYQTFRDNLKKIRFGEDIIFYRCYITTNLDIHFYITQEEDEGLCVSYRHQLPIDDRKSDTFIKVQSDPPGEINEGEEGEKVRPGSISKMEEGEALQFIRRKLIPKAVIEINKNIIGGKTCISHLVTEEDISKNLKKTKHERYDLSGDPNRSDHIEYTSHKIGRPDVIFIIYKSYIEQQNDKGDITPLGLKIVAGYKPIFKTSYSTSHFILENINEEITVARISKLEEPQALQYIRRILVPLAVKWWNDRTDVHPLKEDQILKVLKKMVDRRPDDSIDKKYMNTDYIVYKSIIPCEDLSFNNKISFEFPITKNVEGKVEVNFRSNLIDVGPFWVGENPLSLKEGSLIEHGEVKTTEDYSVSKMEEAEALQFIRNVLIKNISQEYDFDANLIRQTLKKIRHDIYPNWGDIRYRANTGRLHPEIDFSIYKNDKAQICVGIDHEYNSHRVFRIDDYLKTNLVKENSEQDINRSQRLTKEDEQRGFDYIKRFLVPLAVKEFERRFNIEIRGQDIRRILKKTEHYRASTNRSENDYVAYEAPSPFEKLKFVFEVYKNNAGGIMASWGIIRKEATGAHGVGTMNIYYVDPDYDEYQPRQWVMKENVENKLSISKLEEAQAVDVIKKKLIPEFIKYMDDPTKYNYQPLLSVEDSRRTLKKIAQVYHRDGYITQLYYSVFINTAEPFEFWVFKNNDGIVCILNKWNDRITHVGGTLTENSIPQELIKYSVSKLEEDQAVDFMKKKLIPDLVAWMNDNSKHYTRQRQVTIQEVTRTLKKIEQYKHLIYGFMREITYQALFLGEPFLFEIFKNTEGKLVVRQKSDGTTHLVK